MMAEPEPKRGAYHHGDLRAALVAAGLEVSRVAGANGLGLREVTRRVGVSPNAAYRHFADRDALVREVSHEIQIRMAARMVPDADPAGAGDHAAGAVADLRAVGLGYIGFALAEPGWFDVAFYSSGPAPAPEPGWVPPPYARLVAALDGLVAADVLSPDQRVGAEWPCFSAVHGFAALALHGPLHDRPRPELDRLAARTVDAIIEGVLTTN